MTAAAGPALLFGSPAKSKDSGGPPTGGSFPMSPARALNNPRNRVILSGETRKNYDPIEYFAIDPDIAAAGNDHARRFAYNQLRPNASPAA